MINGANMLDAGELAEHLDTVITVSFSVYTRGRTEQEEADYRNQERAENGSEPSDDSWWELFLYEVQRMLRGADLALAQGPPLRWTAGESIFYTWPVMPASATPQGMLLLRLLRWGEEPAREFASYSRAG